MKDRIIQIMSSEGLTPSQFAEEIGVQRATISHITHNRNKPSNKVVSKILERFPSINPNWLLFGSGEMHIDKNNDNTTISFLQQPQTSPTSSDLFANPSHIRPQEEKKSEYRTDLTDKTPVRLSEPTEKETIVIKEIPAKKIEKITVFYSDNTYETFVVEKKS